MILYIDGDAFPNLLKPVVLRAILKHSLSTVIIANKRVSIGISKNVTNIIVGSGPDEADNKIAEFANEGDLVITSDIPLADRVIDKKAFVIDHRGKFYDAENIKQALAIRNLMQEIRDGGEILKGQKSINEKDVREFANQMNQFLRKKLK